jgi:preprotein translocase subunit SecE
MNEQIQSQGSNRSGGALPWLAGALVIAGVAAFYVLSGQSAWLRWLAVVAGLVLGAVVFGLSGPGHAFVQFWGDSRNELRKVVWPTMEDTRRTTLMVFVFAVVAGIFFWSLDLFLAWATRHLTGQGG